MSTTTIVKSKIYNLKSILKQLSCDLDVQLRTDYHGRGMYEDSCIGFITNGNLSRLIMQITEWLVLSKECNSNMLLQEMMRNVKSDSMGLGTILYFPNISLE